MKYLRLGIMLLVLINTAQATAQDNGAFAVITSDNVAQVVTLARLGNGTISKVAWSPDAETLAVAGSLGVWLYDSGQLDAPPRLLEGHTERVLDVAFSPDGTLIATGSADHTARIWDIGTGTTLHVFRHEDWVRSVAFSPDGTTLATGGGWDQVVLWDVHSGAEKSRFQKFCAYVAVDLAYSPDGHILACASDSIYSDAPHGGIAWLDLDTGTIGTGQWAGSPTYSVAFSPDGTRLAGSREVYSFENEAVSQVALWDASTGALLIEGVFTRPGNYYSRVNEVSFSHTGGMVAAAATDGLELMEVATGAERTRLLSGQEVEAVAFSPVDDRLAYIAENVLHVRDLSNGLENVAIHTPPVTSTAFVGADDVLLVGREGGGIEEWDAVTGRKIRQIRNPDGSDVARIEASPDGSLIAISRVTGEMWWDNLWGVNGDVSGDILVIDRESGDTLVQLETEIPSAKFVPAAAFSPDGKSLVYTCKREALSRTVHPLQVLDMATMTERTFPESESEFASFQRACASTILFGADGEHLLVSDQGALRIVDFRDDFDGRGLIAPYWGLNDIDGSITAADWSPDGTLVAYSVYHAALGGGSSSLHLWPDVREGLTSSIVLADYYHTPQESRDVYRSIYAITLNVDGTLLVTVGADLYGTQSDVYVWDIETRSRVAVWRGHRRDVTTVAMNRAGSLVATGSADGTVIVWGVP